MRAREQGDDVSGDAIMRCLEGDRALRPGPARPLVSEMRLVEGGPVGACQFLDGVGQIMDQGFVGRFAQLEESTMRSCS